jgi:phage terminase large subunit-like protein
VIARKPRLEKLVRANAQAPCFEAGRVFLPREAAWLVDYETVILGFPSAKYDDQVDSTVQFLKWAEERNAYATPTKRIAQTSTGWRTRRVYVCS